MLVEGDAVEVDVGVAVSTSGVRPGAPVNLEFMGEMVKVVPVEKLGFGNTL